MTSSSDSARIALAESLPDEKFVAILREPVGRAYSQYWFARSKGVESFDTFESAIESCVPTGRAGGGRSADDGISPTR